MDVRRQDIQRHPRRVWYACDAMTSGPSCQSCQDGHRASGGIFSFSRFLVALSCVRSFSLGPLPECRESVFLRAVIVVPVSLSHSLLSLFLLYFHRLEVIPSDMERRTGRGSGRGRGRPPRNSSSGPGPASSSLSSSSAVSSLSASQAINAGGAPSDYNMSVSKPGVPIFDSENYHVWAFDMRSFLLADGSFGAIDEQSNQWASLSEEAKLCLQYRAFNWLRTALGRSYVYMCADVNPDSPRVLWLHIRSLYVKDDMATKLKLEQRFQNIYWDTTRHHVDSFLQELYLLRMEHTAAGFPLSDQSVFTKLMLCLPAEFDIERSQMKEWVAPDLGRARKLLKEREETLLSRRESLSSRPMESGTLFFAGSSSSSGVDLGPQRTQFKYKCFYCNKQGHRKFECRTRLRDLGNAGYLSNSSDVNLHPIPGTRNSGPINQVFHRGNRGFRGARGSGRGRGGGRGGSVSYVESFEDAFDFSTTAVSPPVEAASGHIALSRDANEIPNGVSALADSAGGFVYMMQGGAGSPSSWLIDTGATDHICKDLALLNGVVPYSAELVTGKKEAKMVIEQCGSLLLRPRGGEYREVTISKVLYSKDATMNIISVAALIKQGCNVIIQGRTLLVCRDSEPVIAGEADEKGLYHLSSHMAESTGACCAIRDLPKSDALRLLHVRLGHLNVDSIRRMIEEGMVEGIPKDLNLSGVELNCPHCLAGKATRLPYPSKRAEVVGDGRVMSIGDEIVSDSFGPITPTSRNGNRFVVEFIDVASRFAFMFPIPSLDLIGAKYIVFRNLVLTQCGVKIKKFHSDGHGSYNSNELLQMLSADGTLRVLRSPYCPEQNAIAERRIRTVVEMARTMLLHSCVPIICWEDAVAYANYIRNRVASRSIKGKTPYEIFWKTKPSVEWMRPFGCLCYVLIHKELRQGKFSAVSLPGVMIGVSDQHSGYKVLMLGDRTVKIARDVRFYEDIFPFRRSSVSELEWMNPSDCPQVENVEAGRFTDPFIRNGWTSQSMRRDSDLASLYQPIQVVLKRGGPTKYPTRVPGAKEQKHRRQETHRSRTQANTERRKQKIAIFGQEQVADVISTPP